MPADRDLSHLYPAFREKIEKILAGLKLYADKHMPEHEWIVTEGFRSAKYQNELYQKGRTIPPIGSRYIVTYRDGYKKRSAHQSSLAVDIVPKKGKSIVWNAPAEHWAYLGHLARAEKLEWGGDWTKLRDMPHVQWDEDDKATYQAARAWQKKQKLK